MECVVLLVTGRSYLSDRLQYVELDNNTSATVPIKCDAPQGSILGPLLYLIYVNDIGNSCQGNILLFADDTLYMIHYTSRIVILKHYLIIQTNKLIRFSNGFVQINCL